MKLAKIHKDFPRLVCSECGLMVPKGQEQSALRFDWVVKDPDKAVYVACSKKCDKAHWREYNLKLKLWD